MQILPFAVLLGGILCFWRLTRSSELIVARAAGVSAWEFLAAPTFCAFLFGVLATAAVSPVSSVMLARPRRWTTPICAAGGGPLALNGGQLWLRQSDRVLSPQGVAIIHAHGVQLHGKQLTANEVSVFRLDGSRPAAGADRGDQGDARRGRLATGERPHDPSGPVAGAARHDRACRPI